MVAYTIHKGTLKRIPEDFDLKWWASHLGFTVLGIFLGGIMSAIH